MFKLDENAKKYVLDAEKVIDKTIELMKASPGLLGHWDDVIKTRGGKAVFLDIIKTIKEQALEIEKH